MRILSKVVRLNIFSILVSLLVSVQIIQPAQLNAAPTQGSIRTNSNAGVQFATQNTALTPSFTIEAWWKWADGVAPSLGQLLLGGSGTPGIYIRSSNQLQLTRWGGGYDSPYCTLQNSFVAGTWYHLAIGRSSGGLVTVWVNGSPLQNCSKLTVPAFTVGTQFPSFFGGNGAGALFDGYFANYRATSTDIYGAADALGFQPNSNFYSSITGTINLLNTPNDSASVFLDSIGSPSGFTSHTGGILSSEFPTYTPKSICFGGNQARYFSYPSGDTIGTSSFTLEMWVKPKSWSPYMSFLNMGYGAGGGSYFGYNTDTGPTKIIFYNGETIGSNGLGTDVQQKVPVGVWTHVAFVRDQVNTKNYMYINGIKVNEGASSNYNFARTQLDIGSNFDGCMTSVRLAKTALYTSSFTPAAMGSFSSLPEATNVLVAITAGNNSISNLGTAGLIQGTGTITYEDFPKLSQTVTFSSPGNKTMGISPFTLSASSSSGQGVTFTSTTISTCTVSGSTLTLVAVGTCTINADQAGNASFDAAPQVQQSFSISKGAQTIAFTSITDKALSSGTLSISATGGGSGNEVVFTSATASQCTVATTTVIFVAAGTCTINANQLGNDNYNAASQVQQSFTILKSSSRTIDFATTSFSLNFGDTQTVTASVSAGLGAISYSSGISSACSVDSTTGLISIISGTGTCSISATSAEDANYLSKTTATPVTITVGKANQSGLTLLLSTSSKASPYSQALTFAPSGGTGSGATTYAITAGGTASGCALANSGDANTITATTAGTCLIKATKAADSNYSEVNSASQSFTFSTSNQAADLAISSVLGTYGTDLSLTTTGGSGTGVVSFATTTPGCSLPSSTTLRATGAITCEVTATKPADANFNVASSPTTNVVFAPKPLTISGLTGVNKEFNGDRTSAQATGTPTLVGVVDGDVVTLVGTPVFTFDTANVGTSKTVTASGYTLTNTNAANYSLTQPSMTADITAKAITVTAANVSIGFGGTVISSVSAPGLISPNAISGATYTYSTGTATPPTTVGVSSITPSLATFSNGNASNYSITYVAGTLNILAAYTVTYNANGGSVTPTSAPFVVGSSALELPTPTRSNYHFDGWFDEGTTPATSISGTTYTPIADKTLVAHWTQNSLYGVGAYTDFGSVIVQAGQGGSFSANNATSSVSVTYPSGALPAGTHIHGYLLTDPASAAAVIPGTNNFVVAMVVAWHAVDGTVPMTETGTALTMTMTNASIKKNAKIYTVIAGVATYLTTATVDGSITVSITEDPQIVVVTTKPDAPTSVSATNSGNASSTVSWSAPALDGGSAITGYTAMSNAGQSCATTSTSCSVSGLTNGTAYTFTVTATNAIGISDSSTASSPVTPSAPAPAPAPAPSGGGGGGGGVYVAPTPDPAIAIAEAAKAKAAAEKIAADAKAAADLKAAQDKAAAEAAQAAALKAAQELADAQAKADAELKAAQDKALEDARIAEELRLAQEKAEADLRAAAEKKAAEDAAAAALLAARKIVPNVTLYSISNSLKLSTYDNSYLKKYVSKLKPTAKVTCVGYIYTKNTTYAKAKLLASKQAKAVCALIKKQKKTIITSTLLYPSSKAPKAAAGAKWVAVSYRVDGYKS
jgi:uncharacterized repeat protein (TIGR02543 family)